MEQLEVKSHCPHLDPHCSMGAFEVNLVSNEEVPSIMTGLMYTAIQ
jgi:hypothetical protein